MCSILSLLTTLSLIYGCHSSSNLLFNPLLDTSNDTTFGCTHLSCPLLDELGPPPEWLLPPPPLPPFLQQILKENQSLKDEEIGNCNFCRIFNNPKDEMHYIISKPEVKATDSWLSLLIACVLGSTFFGALFIIFLIKCKKWKIFPVSVCDADSCPIFPESLLGGHKSAPPPCSPSDSCISPVVNEKSPQSVITNCPTNKTCITSKYWRRADLNPREACTMIEPGTTEIDEYTSCPQGTSCTSSPVYAELDAAGVNINHSQIPASLLITRPSESISPYAVHTYTEVADAMRMAALGSSSALLPDASYDNAAYLPSSNSDQYHGRSLPRHNRAATLTQLGSATPLLASQHHITNSQPINYLTGNRPHKKPRPRYAYQMSRSKMLRAQQALDPNSARYAPTRGQDSIYNEVPLHSPSLSTFRVPYALNFRDIPKRPLPPVPGVRL